MIGRRQLGIRGTAFALAVGFDHGTRARMQYIREIDPAKQKDLLEAMHRQLWQSVPYVPLGQFRQPFLWRSNVKGVVRANTVVYWNIEKT